MNAMERRAALTYAYTAKRTGQVVDLTGAWGCQSPDLAVDYLRHLTGTDLYPVGNAVDWVHGGSAGRTVAKLAQWHPNPEYLTGKAAAALHGDAPWVGDLLVYGAARSWGMYGTLGICLQVLPGKSLMAECFTQGHMPAGSMTIATMPLLGWWRVRDEHLQGVAA